MPGYLQFKTTPKAVTEGGDIGSGQVELRHMHPAVFLEMQLIKLHTHEGSDSRKLDAEATPYVVRGFQASERIEHGTATWTGSASAAGSVALTFGTTFAIAPTVFVTVADGSSNFSIGIGVPTTTGVTIYWEDLTAATHTSLDIQWIVIGR
jgi:hypothetical protein